jgi:ATP-dependent protease ClpP protease subunit
LGELSILSLAPDPAASLPRRRNYFARHWRGELSLPVSYWINGTLVAFAGTLLGFRAQLAIDDLNDPRTVLALGIALVVIAVALPVWQFVGVWRSAGQHESRGGLRFWAVTARVMVSLGVLRFAVFSIERVAPQIPVFYVMAVGDRDMKHEVRLVGGRDAVFSGEIGFGATADIEALLDAHPAVTILHLASGGGRVLEARHLHDAIRRRGLTTMSMTLCASACTMAFMGGKERLIGPEARLGFHRSNLPGGGTPLGQKLRFDRDKRLFLEDGVDRAFVQHAYATPNAEMWYPTPDELLRAHVVTRVLPRRAPAPAPVPGEAGSDAAERLGFYGRWAVDCRAPATPVNPVLTLTRDGDGAHYHLSWGGTRPDLDTGLRDLSRSGERELTFSFAIRDKTQHIVATLWPGRMRTLQSWNDGGQVMIKDGVNIGNGKETPYFERCG